MNASARPITIRSGDTSCEGLLHMRAFNPRQRMMRAAKIWGLMWFFALLSAPICGIHLVAVPAFLIAGPLMGVRRYRMMEVPDHVTGKCPSGGEEFSLAVKASDSLPMSVSCPTCGAWLHLRKKEEVPVP
jgi:hypothetical protein